jgi:hypothetical protein
MKDEKYRWEEEDLIIKKSTPAPAPMPPKEEDVAE